MVDISQVMLSELSCVHACMCVCMCACVRACVCMYGYYIAASIKALAPIESVCVCVSACACA